MSPQAGWPAALAVFAGGLVCGAYVGKVPPALPAQREALGLSLVESGFIATTFNLIGLAGGMFFGLLCDRLGHKRVGLAGLGLMALAGAGGALASDFFALLLTRFLEGVGFMLYAVAGSALMAATMPAGRERLKAMGLWSAYMPTGASVALLAAPPLLAAWGWRGLWAVLATAAAMSFVLVARAAPAPRFGGVGFVRLARESLSQPAGLALAALFAFYVAQWTSVMVWLPTFLAEERAAAQGTASLLTALMVLANVPGNLAGGWLLSRGVRRGRLILFACAAMAATDVAMLTPVLPDALRYVACLAFSLCAGVIPACVFSGVVVHARTPAHVGTTNGLVMQTSQAGQFFGPIALAWLAAGGGWSASLWAMLGFAAGGALCGLAVARIEHKAKPARL
ncbi:MAG: MFS transporter [Burkholderiales bacterium]|nr:MFS transporter [Burkholderiales bacterium]